ncbi:MAG: type I restriction endonuclease subunit R [Methanosphaera stadtmanae]|nr:type I restriction endonuclease subunit R [Methanosphaera stadtmanae]
MSTESEAVLENKLIEKLTNNGYSYIKLDNEDDLNSNFKKQLEKLNNVKLTDEEFDRLLIYLDDGSIFEKSRKLRDKYYIKREDESFYLKFLNQKEWCKNIFQVSNQITMVGKYENRYDVTILINGLPLVQIELKRRGMELKKAFNQIQRYWQHSYKGLFNYIQLFVISNGINSKYFANVDNILDFSYDQTFYWKDEKNNNIYKLDPFTETFLEKCNLARMISQYMVLNEDEKKIIVLRAYQKYAVEAILKQALEYKQNGYIWHTTGSGKTLTSFKTCRLLSKEKSVDKVVFVVDRNDLDDQTSKEFNKFSPGSIIDVSNTYELIRKLSGDDKLIVTTIQKLNNAVKRDSSKLKSVKDKHIIFIYDECHRSHFGTMHDNIENYFTDSLSYGFTGTPIFAINANGDKTTSDIFGRRLHSYLIKDAIADNNVLGFSIDYFSTAKRREGLDEDVASIDTREVLEADDRIEMICDYIIKSYKSKTHNAKFNAMLTVSQGTVIHKYYKYLRNKDPSLKIACIYTFDANGELIDGFTERDYLEAYIQEYNKMFNTNFSTDTFSEYQKDISKRMKKREEYMKSKTIDLLLVKDMFLTGFDSPSLNTLYVDKKMVYHTLLQAYSRTNRLNGKQKPHGNIVVFRSLQEETDKALRLFSDDAPLETILMYDYKHYVKEFNDELDRLYDLVKTVEDAQLLISEKDKREFVLRFRELIRTKNKLDNFTEFTFDDVNIEEQEFDDFKSEYFEIYEEFKEDENTKVSILDDIDFELELIENDEVNVDYILKLLKEMTPETPEYPAQKKHILKLVKETEKLRSKIDLIEKFIDDNIGRINKEDGNVEDEFNNFMEEEKKLAIAKLILEEELDENVLRNILSEYEFSAKFDDEQVDSAFTKKMGIVERYEKRNYLINKIKEILEKFEY